MEKTYRHHLVPRVKGGAKKGIVQCCKTCSRQVHMLFSDLTEAEKAKKALNGFDFEGCTLKVDKYYSSRHQSGTRGASKKRRFRRN